MKKPYPLNVEDYSDPHAWKLRTRRCCGSYEMNDHYHYCSLGIDEISEREKVNFQPDQERQKVGDYRSNITKEIPS